MTSNKDYCYKFINHLLEKNVIVDNKIDRKQAGTIYVESFKPNNQKTNFSFSTMCDTLRRLYLIDNNKQNLVFQQHILNRFATNQNPEKKSQNSAGKTSNTTLQCNICRIQAANETAYNDHLKTDRHMLLNRYVNNIKLMINAINGLSIEVENNHGGLQETFMLRTKEQKSILLQLINKSGQDYKITEIIELTPRADITLHKTDLLSLKNGTTLILKIDAHFNNVVYIVYPIVFRLKVLQSDKVTDVLKELIFHVHSSNVDDLHSTTSFNKRKKVLPVVEPVGGIVRGEHMKRGETDFKPLIILQQYNLSDNLVIVLNNGFNDFEGMNKIQFSMLRDIRNLLHNFKFKDNEKLNERNYYEMLRLLLFLEEYQMRIDIQKYFFDDANLLKVKGYHQNCLELKVPGLSEQRPSLLRGDSVYIKEASNSAIKYEGIVHKVLLDSVILGFSNKFINKVHVDKKKYYASFNFNRVPLRAEHQAINLINEHRAISILCKDNFQPNSLKNHDLVWFNKNVGNNLQQQQAVRHILSQTARPMPYLVFGPPGTGKTVTVVEAVLQVWKLLPTKHVLICAPSNTAADEVAKRLVEIIPKRDLFRYVAPSYPYDLLYERVKPFINYKNNDYYHPANTTLLKYRIVITTLVNASRLVNGGTPQGHFEYVFIDESGQATESESLIPIAGILTSNATKGGIVGQIVLAGDPKQLGPIIHSSQATLYGFATSMLERLMKNNSTYQKNKAGEYNKAALTKLVQSYRSHPAILKVPNKLFYDDQLIPSADMAMTHIAVGWDYLPNPHFPVIFHSVIGKDDREGSSPSFFNVEEIDVVLSYLSLLLGNKLQGMKITEEHIGIIAPYRKQVFKLKQACQKKHYGENLFIGSVEQFQGQERLIIIVTTVRSRPEYTSYDAKFHLGFLKNPKRFNVAITRAKALLIVIGNPKILMLDSNWNAFIKHCQDNNSTRGTPFDLPMLADLTETIGALKISDPIIEPNNAEEGPGFARGRI